MIGFCPLASGSKGNCIYFGTGNTKVLIDAGISGKATKQALASIDVDIADIDAIIITHEHTDHIRGLKVLAYNMGIPVFANSETAKGIAEKFHGCPQFKIFSTGETFEFHDMEIHPFTIQHDAADPVAFTIHAHDIKTGFCTDIGFVTSLVQNHLKDCDYLYIESNHQPSMVHSCSRPYVCKQRVLGRSGHLSNEACGNLISTIHHPGLKHVHLAHLSHECNSPEYAIKTIQKILHDNKQTVEISIAQQNTVSKAIHFLP